MLLSIIIVSYNKKELLKNCLKSVFKQIKAPFELIVVDNASSDGSAKMVKKEFPKAKIIFNKENIGFGRANNQGIKKAKGDYILLLNQDTLVLDGAIDKLIDFIKEKGNLGAVGPQILNKDSSLQPSGGFWPSLSKVLFWSLGIDDLPIIKNFFPAYQIRASHFYQKKRFDFDWLMGACLLIRKKVFEKVGSFDEVIFMYGEEVEWCFRLKKLGFKIGFLPDAKIIHLGGGSQSIKESAIINENKSLLYFYKKHFPKQFFLVKCLIRIGMFLRLLIFATIFKNDKRKQIYKKAWQSI